MSDIKDIINDNETVLAISLQPGLLVNSMNGRNQWKDKIPLVGESLIWNKDTARNSKVLGLLCEHIYLLLATICLAILKQTHQHTFS